PRARHGNNGFNGQTDTMQEIEKLSHREGPTARRSLLPEERVLQQPIRTRRKNKKDTYISSRPNNSHECTLSSAARAARPSPTRIAISAGGSVQSVARR